MENQAYTSKIAYACIYSTSIEQAADNLIRLIVSGDSGFNEGPAEWRSVLSGLLTEEDLSLLSKFGAPFDHGQWVRLLQLILDGLPSE